ncbi:acetate kinase [bacterium]|nr:acetate kinase [bacterium]
MKVLVLNSGSSSLKYQLIETEGNETLAKGMLERIGLEMGKYSHEVPSRKIKRKVETPVKDHQQAVGMVIDILTDPELGVIKDIHEINAVGHRVVHGGSYYSGSVLITEDVMDVLQECSELAPLHNPANLVGIMAAQQILPDVPMVGVFDTAFHQTMPEHAYLYAIPYEYYEKYKVRRYGFHGTSHRYVSKRAAEILGKDPSEVNVITCHMGNGTSFAAVKGGESVDTSMGFTPLEGMIMGTRCGDLDPSIVYFLEEKEGLCCGDVDKVLNKKSGLLGVSGISSDMRDLEDAAAQGHHRSQVALDIFAYRAKKYIGSYAVALGRVDAIVFTAGVGENGPEMREEICKGLEVLGAKLDPVVNNFKGLEKIVSTDDSKVKLIVIPTNEELMIALDTEEVVLNSGK